jgi:hypothetical protein
MLWPIRCRPLHSKPIVPIASLSCQINMPGRLLRIAGLTLSVCWSDQSRYPMRLGWDDSFGVDTGTPVCVIRVQRGCPSRWKAPGAKCLEFSSAGAWAAFRQNGGWTFVSPAPDAEEWQRLLLWSPCRGEAELWLNPSVVGDNLFQNLTLPYFTALFAKHQGMLVHAAAVEVDGGAWVFAGPSGSGKSHWTRQWQERGMTVLDEDRVVLRQLDGQVWAFGTPWHAEPRLCSPQGAPVERIFFLQRAEADAVQETRPASAATLLLRSSMLPIYDPEGTQAVLDVAGQAATQARPFLIGRITDKGLLDRLALL